MVRFTLRRLSLVALVALVISVAADTARLIQAPVALAEERAQGTGLTLSSFVRVVDGKSIDAVIDGRRVAIAVHGIDTPQGNTSCGKQAADALKAATRAARTRGGVRLVDDPSDQFDSRGRKIFYLEDTSGRPLADDLVKAGVARANGKGKDKDRLRQADDDARGNRRGCLWTGGRQGEINWPPADGPVVAMNDYAAAHDVALAEAAEAVRQGATIPHAAPALDQTRAQADDENPDTAMVKSAMIRAAQEQVNAVPNGFQDEMVVDGIGEPTAFAFLPDGRVLVATKSGIVRVIKNGALLPTPFIDLQSKVNDYWDRGLLGIAVDPAFAIERLRLPLLHLRERRQRLQRHQDLAGDPRHRDRRHRLAGQRGRRSSARRSAIRCNDFPVGADCLPTDFFGTASAPSSSPRTAPCSSRIGEGANFNVVDDDALRAQDLDCLAGKMLRITTDRRGRRRTTRSGTATPTPTAPRSGRTACATRTASTSGPAPASRSSATSAGAPGKRSTSPRPGANLGWPCYEGAGRQAGYEPKPVCQTLYGQGASAVKAPLDRLEPQRRQRGGDRRRLLHRHGLPRAVPGRLLLRRLRARLHQVPEGRRQQRPGRLARPTSARHRTPSRSRWGRTAPSTTSPSSPARFGGSATARRPRRHRPRPAPQYLSDLTWISATNGWGPVEKDKSNGEDRGNDGSTITLNGTTYPRGSAPTPRPTSATTWAAPATRFFADVGVDDEMGSHGSVVFQVWLDGVKAWDSGTMTGDHRHQAGRIGQRPRRHRQAELQLVITDAGNGNTSDHGDWANARVACGGSNTPPIATISAPTSTLKYKVGDTINFAGSATDAQDGALAPANLSWTIRLHHCPGGACHTHQLLQQSGIASGSFVAPDEADDNKIEIILTATDSAGLTGTASVMLLPQTVQVTIATNPAGYQVVYSGTPGTAPMTQTAIVGSQRTIQATSRRRTAPRSRPGRTAAPSRTTSRSPPPTRPTPPRFSGGAAADRTTTYLSDMTWTSATNGYGPVEKNKSNGEAGAGDGTTLTLNGVTYAKGLGTHAASDVRYTLPSNCTQLEAQVGVDDEVGTAGNVVFQVWLDGSQSLGQRHHDRRDRHEAGRVGHRPGHHRQDPASAGGDRRGRRRHLRSRRLGRREGDVRRRTATAAPTATARYAPIPQRPDLDLGDQRLRPGREGPEQRRRRRRRRHDPDAERRHLRQGARHPRRVRHPLQPGRPVHPVPGPGRGRRRGRQRRNVVFQVWLDGVKAWDSGNMTGATATKPVGIRHRAQRHRQE